MKQLNDLLDQLCQEGYIRPLDKVLARFLGHKGKENRTVVPVIAALISQASSLGHTCFDLKAYLDGIEKNSLPAIFLELKKKTAQKEWLTEFASSPLIDDYGKKQPSPKDCAPLVLDENGFFYLRRYWQYETDVARFVTNRTKTRQIIAPQEIAPLFDLFFPDQEQETNWQKIACALALTSSFSIITGGPGTGKTTTVVRLLAIMQARSLQNKGKLLDIAMAAPTGKAAARLQESIQGQLKKLPSPVQHAPWTEIFTTKTQTLHKLLGALPAERSFRKNASSPLAHDVIIVDEASMLDLELLHALLEATPPGARLVLLGDKDQLASVEAGYVLGSLCSRSATGHYTPETAAWLEKSCEEKIPETLLDPYGSNLDQSIILLRKSYRFGTESGIGQAAALANMEIPCQTSRFLSCFAKKKDLTLIHLTGPEDNKLKHHALDEYQKYIDLLEYDPKKWQRDQWAHSLLREFSAFQLLTPLRNGVWGVKNLNEMLTAAFQAKTDTRSAEWFHGRPVLVTRNQPRLGLMNGDIGLTLAVEINGERVLRVAFPAEHEKILWLAPSRLEAIETAFALTVHKAQGSEFAHCALVLPDKPSQVLSRELLYTAITRTKKRFYLFLSEENVLDYTLGRGLIRTSGLASKIEKNKTAAVF